MSAARPSEIERIALDLTRSAARFTRFVGQVPGIGYSSIAWRVLADLERDGAARVSVLAHAQRVAQPSMTGLVNRLASEGWLSRGPDPDDGRATLVAITDAGAAALDRYRRTAAEWVSPLLAELSDEEREVLDRAAALMQRLSERPVPAA